MSQEVLLFPRGAIAMGNGDLIQVSDVKITKANGAAQVDTLGRSPAGYTMGKNTSTGSFTVSIPESGAERDFWGLVDSGEVKQIRLKIPGKTLAFNIVISQDDIDLPIDAPITESISFLAFPVQA